MPTHACVCDAPAALPVLTSPHPSHAAHAAAAKLEVHALPAAHAAKHILKNVERVAMLHGGTKAVGNPR